MEASALTSAGHSGLLARRSPLLRLQSDERLVALIREGHDRAFEVLFDRYQTRLLAFCRHLVNSVQDAEDVLQEVFVAAHGAMLADERAINARPWLYRIARNRCLNHLRRPVAEGQDSMDIHAHSNGANTLEQVQNREELRQIFSDVHDLPETQRTALVLREIDDLSYTEIAQAMGTTLPAVKSLLVRARMSLAEASEARVLTCDEVRLELAEAVEGLRKLSGPARRHVRDCGPCHRYRDELRSTTKALGALAPFGLAWLAQKLFGIKLGGGSTAGGSAGSAGSAGGAAGSAGGAAGSAGGAAGSAGGAAAAAGGSGATFGGAVAAAGSAAGGIGGALGAKAAVGMATAALITAGAVGVNDLKGARDSSSSTDTVNAVGFGDWTAAPHGSSVHRATHPTASASTSTPTPESAETATAPPEEAAPAPATEAPAPAPEDAAPADDGAVGASTDGASTTPAPADPTDASGASDGTSSGTDIGGIDVEPAPTTDPPATDPLSPDLAASTDADAPSA